MSLHSEPLDVEVDGEALGGTVIASDSPGEKRPGALFVHGWGGNQEQYLARARAVAATGYVCLTFDLRGHERTLTQHEAVTREQNLRDVVAAYDMLVARPGVDNSRIALIGSSYGAYLGVLATQVRRVRWLSLRAPAIYKDAGWDLPKRALHRDPEFADYRLRAHLPGDNRAMHACACFRGDVLVVESGDDRIVPHAVIASYVQALATGRSLTYRVIESADHGLTQERWKQAYSDLLLAWLKEMAGAATRPPTGSPASTARLPAET